MTTVSEHPENKDVLFFETTEHPDYPKSENPNVTMEPVMLYLQRGESFLGKTFEQWKKEASVRAFPLPVDLRKR